MNTNGVILFLLLMLCGVLYIYHLRKQENLKRTLKLAFLRVTMPKKNSDLDEKQETTKDFKEMIGLMEQLLASLNSISSHKLKKRILGQDHISLEYITHNGEILFYVVCPNNYKGLIEKQINGFYPDAIIEETPEVNIFAGRKYWETTYINTKKEYFYPFKTYQKLESDPINNITNAFSILKEDESAALQLLVKPIDDDWQEECQNISSKIMDGKKEALFSLNPLKMIIGFITIFFNQDEQKPEPGKNKTSALTQERAKIVDEKAEKTGYETIIRVITTGNSKS